MPGAATAPGRRVTTSLPTTFGIEEEYFLAHAGTRTLVRRAPKRLLRECRRRLGPVVFPELLNAQLEIASPVFSSSAEARERMTAFRATVAEVADLMRVSKMTVYRLVHSGELPAVRFGRSYRVPGTAVTAALQRPIADVG